MPDLRYPDELTDVTFSASSASEVEVLSLPDGPFRSEDFWRSLTGVQETNDQESPRSSSSSQVSSAMHGHALFLSSDDGPGTGIPHGVNPRLAATYSAPSPLLSTLYRTLSIRIYQDGAAQSRRLGASDAPAFAALRHHLKDYSASPVDTPASQFYVRLAQEDLFAYSRIFMTLTSTMKFFITAKGRLGMGPRAMRTGDEIIVLQGGNMPFVIRTVCGGEGEDAGMWKDKQMQEFIGAAYIDGIMDGETVNDIKDNDMKNAANSKENPVPNGRWEQIYLI